MQAGNATYLHQKDIPVSLPVLFLSSTILFPGGFIPLTLSDPCLIEMVDDALAGNRLVGLVMSCDKKIVSLFESNIMANNNTSFQQIGCIGRITNYSEVGDGEILIALQGVCRFRIDEQISSSTSYPQFHICPFYSDLVEKNGLEKIDRKTFFDVFQDYLALNCMQVDWEIMEDAPDETLVNGLSVLVPFNKLEKQALLEAPDLKNRSEIMIAIAQRALLVAGKGNFFLQ